MSDLADRALRKSLKILIPTDHPKADIFAKVLGKGLCTTSGSAKRRLKEGIKAVKE